MRIRKSLTNTVITVAIAVALGFTSFLPSIVKAQLTPYITFNTFSGHPGDTLLVSGGNFAANNVAMLTANGAQLGNYFGIDKNGNF